MPNTYEWLDMHIWKKRWHCFASGFLAVRPNRPTIRLRSSSLSLTKQKAWQHRPTRLRMKKLFAAIIAII